MKNYPAKPIWKQKKFFIPVILIALLIGVRIVLEPVMLKVANEQAKTINPVFEGHIDDLDISILRGGLLLEDMTGKIKDSGKQFVTVEDVLVDLSWKSLFKGDIRFDVTVDAFDLIVNKDLLAAVKKLPKEEKEKKELPFELSELVVRNSKVTLPDYPGLNNQKFLSVNNIEGMLTGLSGAEGSELAKYNFTAGLSKPEDVTLTGNLDISQKEPRWDLNAHLKKFDLASGNKALTLLLPMNFKKGTLDLYSEVKSENGKMYGYVKPFLNNVEFMGNKKNEFKGAKQFFIELAGEVTDFVFRNSEKKSVATRVPFIYEDGAFSVEGGGALVDAVQHGLLENETVDRGIEQKYRLNRPNPKEVQAQEDNLDEAKEKKVEKDKEEKEKKEEEKK